MGYRDSGEDIYNNPSSAAIKSTDGVISYQDSVVWYRMENDFYPDTLKVSVGF